MNDGHEIYTPPSSYSAQPHPPHRFRARESNDHRRNDHVPPESEAEWVRLHLALARLEREEAVKTIEEIKKKEEARKVARKMAEAIQQEKDETRKQEEAKRLEEEEKRREEEARRSEEEVKRKEYNSPPPTPEIEQKKASQASPPPRARRESDVMLGPVMNEVRSFHLDIDYY